MVRGVALAVVLAVVAGCNSLLGIEDLTLVDAVPADAQSIYVVREGLAGYAQAKDTYIIETAPTTTHGDDEELQWSTTDNKHALLRFDDLFGAGGIPAGAMVQTATLEVTVVEAGSMAVVYDANVDWDESTTHMTLGPTPGVFPLEDRGQQAGMIDGTTLGKKSINVTQSLKRWADAPTTNRGWIVSSLDATLTRVASSEAGVEDSRPTLTVEITP